MNTLPKVEVRNAVAGWLLAAVAFVGAVLVVSMRTKANDFERSVRLPSVEQLVASTELTSIKVKLVLNGRTAVFALAGIAPDHGTDVGYVLRVDFELAGLPAEIVAFEASSGQEPVTLTPGSPIEAHLLDKLRAGVAGDQLDGGSKNTAEALIKLMNERREREAISGLT